MVFLLLSIFLFPGCGWPNTLLPLKWRERKSKSEKSLNFSAFFFASLPNGRIKLNELEVPLGLNEAAFCGGPFPVPPGGEGRNEPRGICGHSCVCVCEGSVGVCVCEPCLWEEQEPSSRDANFVGATWVLRVTYRVSPLHLVAGSWHLEAHGLPLEVGLGLGASSCPLLF